LISFESIRSGNVTPGGSTGSLHGRTLMALRDIVDNSLAEMRLDTGTLRIEPIAVVEFLEEVEIGALIQSQAYGVPFTISSPVDRTLTIEGDRQILAAALANLIDNAFQHRTEQPVFLTTSATADRVLFEVQDGCGSQQPTDRRRAESAIAIKAAKASNGEIRTREVPGKGCIFTLDLPRKAP
jgi:light-regulated signal transduction histidine kinase (bacteriophytochrome)